jgi:GGDEF domain-containing protein
VAEAKAAALSRAIEREPMAFGDWSAPIHLSFGVCEVSQDLEPEAIVAQADAAMYARKRARKAG